MDAARGGASSVADGGPIRNVDDAGGVGAKDELSGGEHFGAIASFAETGERRTRSRETTEEMGGDHAGGIAREGLGVSDEGVTGD
jgi:hypothetical protein